MATKIDSTLRITPPTPEHLPGLRGAKTIETPGLREIKVVVEQLFGDSGIILIDGKPGVGKTFGTKHVLASVDVPVHWVDMPDTPKGKEANTRIFMAVTGRRPPDRMTEFALTQETVDVLDGLESVLAIDEAQNMTSSALRQVRFLHDRPTTKALLILLGPGVTDVVRRVPELDSRVARRININALSGSQMRHLLPELHPMLAATDGDVITRLSEYAKGNLRNWARIVEVASNLRIPCNSGIDEKAANFIIRSITGGGR